MNRTLLLRSIVLSALLVVAVALARGRGGRVTANAQTAPSDPATVRLYHTQCATCHGDDGRGQTTAGRRVGARDLTDPATYRGLTDAEIARRIREGVRGDDGRERMPAYPRLTPSQIDALVAYVRAFVRRGA